MSLNETPLAQKFSPRERAKIQQAASGMAGQNPTNIHLGDSNVTTQANRPGELSEIMDIRVPKDQIFVFPRHTGLKMYLPVHEQFTTDGSGGTDETFNLSESLVDSPSVTDPDTSQSSGGSEVDANGAADLVVYDEGVQKAVVSADFDANTFTYADADTDSTLDVYYLAEFSSHIVGRAYDATLESFRVPFGGSVSQFHRARVFNTESKQTFKNTFALAEKEHLKFYINTPVDLTNWDAIDASGPNGTSSYAYAEIPVYKLEA